MSTLIHQIIQAPPGWMAAYVVTPDKEPAEENPLVLDPIVCWGLVVDEKHHEDSFGERRVVGFVLDQTEIIEADFDDRFLGYVALGENADRYKDQAIRLRKAMIAEQAKKEA